MTNDCLLFQVTVKRRFPEQNELYEMVYPVT